jgi:benzoyl-CoA reductase/2-hydroxyglutaryl-CoA dehydratase subunit BcrC/BadD/HgdB
LKTIKESIPAAKEEPWKIVNSGLERVVDTVQKKNNEVLKTVDAVVNNPVTNITAAIIGGDVEKRVKQVQEVVKEAKVHPLVVGNNKFGQYSVNQMNMLNKNV